MSADYEQCPAGQRAGGYSCRFCYEGNLHRGDSECPCATTRPQTHLATLCLLCAEAFDVLHQDGTLVARIHKVLTQEALMTYMPSAD